MLKDRQRVKTSQVACAVSGTRYTLYEAPPQCRSLVTFLNISTGAINNVVILEIYKAESATRFKLVNGRSLHVGENVTFGEIEIALESGDRLEITATAGTLSTEAVCTVHEYFKPLG